MPQIEKEYVLSGQLQLAYRYLPLDKHPLAAGAAQAAECAKRQGQFWPMHDRMFAPGAQLDASGLHVIATSLDLDDAAYDACLKEPESKAAVSSDMVQARTLGLESTPAFLLGSRMRDGRVQVAKAFYGALSIDQFRSEIDRARTPATSSWFKRIFSVLLLPIEGQ